MKNRMRRFPIAMTMVFLAALSVAPSAYGQIQAISTVYGASYGELGARWWEWVLSIPRITNPNLDTTGANCAVGQTGRVWFLAGVFAETAPGPINRSCTVPAGKAIFFPIVNTVTFLPFDNETILDLRKQAAAEIDAASNLRCTLDGRPCHFDFSDLRAQTPIFEVISPAKPPSLQMLPPGTYDPMVADGYWLLLTPLRPGQHVLRFGGKIPSAAVDVTYHLTVQGR